MSEGHGSAARGGPARTLLAALLPDDPWCREFVEELDAERARVRGGTWWYAGRVVSPRTLRFVWMMRRRRAAMMRRGWRGGGPWAGAWLDVRQTTRTFLREPRTALFVTTTLALGIGSVSAMGGVAHRLFLAGPPGVHAPDELVRLLLRFEDAGLSEPRVAPWIPWETALAVRDGAAAFAGLTLYRRDETLGRAAGTVRPLQRAEVDGEYFTVLGTAPVAGRPLGPRESGTAVVSESLAVAGWGGAAAAVGRTLELGGAVHEIVGVVGAGFAGPHLDRVDVWTPLDVSTARNRNWWVVGRLPGGPEGDGVTRARAEAQAAHERTDPGRFFQWARDGTILLAPVGADDAGRAPAEASVARLLLLVVGVVLLIGCANVVNLLLARLARREGEILVRLALGIGRGRLARLLVTESVGLGVLGGLLSLPVAHLGGIALRRVLLPEVAWSSSPLDARLLGWTAALAVGTGLVLGLLPLRAAHRSDLAPGLSVGRVGGRRGRARSQAILATVQMALSATLLIAAGLFVKSFWTIRVTDLGVAGETVTVRLRSLEPAALRDGSDAERDAYRRALGAVRVMPGVERAALTVGLPFWSNFGKSVWVAGLDSIPDLPGGGPFISAVGAGYFDAIGTSIVRGSGVTDAHEAGAERVVVVSATTAHTLWPAGDELDACVRFDGPDAACHRVVGVAEDVHRQGYREPPSLQFYVPLGTESGIGGMSLVVRPAGDVEPLRTRIAAALNGLDPAVDHVEVGRLDDLLAAQVRPWRLGAAVLAPTAIVALLVSLIGVYGVLSYLVAQRRREIGVRMALGATGLSIQSHVLRVGLVAGGAGVAAGVAVVLLGGRWVGPLLFETSVADPLVLGVVGATLVGAAAVACLVPSVQAARVDPVECLRSEG